MTDVPASASGPAAGVPPAICKCTCRWSTLSGKSFRDLADIVFLKFAVPAHNELTARGLAHVLHGLSFAESVELYPPQVEFPLFSSDESHLLAMLHAHRKDFSAQQHQSVSRRFFGGMLPASSVC